MDARVLIIIPAFNEGTNIKAIINRIKRNDHVDVAVIDDGSADNTAEAAASAGAQVIAHPFNMGYGIALQTGYKYALAESYDYVIQLDGDGQHNPDDISAFIKGLKDNEADLILGSRFLGKAEYKITFPRKIGMYIFRSLLSLLMRKKLTDPTTGYQGMNRKVLDLYAKDSFPHDYPDADVLLALHLADIRIKEIPTTMYKSAAFKSMHSGFKPVYYMLKMLISIFVTLLRPKGE